MDLIKEEIKMIKTSDFLFEMGLSVEDMKDYREYLSESVGTKESFNIEYRDRVMGSLMQGSDKVYGNQFIDIFECRGCRYIIFEKDVEGFYKINVKTFVVKTDTFTDYDYEKTIH